MLTEWFKKVGGLVVLTWMILGLFSIACSATLGENRCNGDPGEWDLPYGCDLNQSYDEPFLITDTRDTYPYYANINSYDIHRLDVFYPHECLTSRDCRVLINVHGGAWKDYYKDMIDNPEGQHASWYMSGKKGWIVVVPDYRLCNSEVFKADDSCPDRDHCNKDAAIQAAVYPNNVEDVSAIINWVWNNGYLYGARSSGGAEPKGTDIWVLGHSAGGHLVTDWATNPNFESERRKVRGVISLSGAYDILTLAPLLWSAVNETFINISSKKTGSPYHNIQWAPVYPYPKLLVLDCDLKDLANLGAPQVVNQITYPDEAQEFVDKYQSVGYRVSADVAQPAMDMWHVVLTDYRHVDEYAATSFTAGSEYPSFFEPLYVQWEKAPVCEEESDQLGPRLGECPDISKPPGGSWISPTDVVVAWIEMLSPPIIYVSKDDDCSNHTPCYSTIQAALDASGAKTEIRIGQGVYDEAPVKNASGTATITGGWNNAFISQTSGVTRFHAPRVSQGSLEMMEVVLVP